MMQENYFFRSFLKSLPFFDAPVVSKDILELKHLGAFLWEHLFLNKGP
jgi:hypothetical protein